MVKVIQHIIITHIKIMKMEHIKNTADGIIYLGASLFNTVLAISLANVQAMASIIASCIAITSGVLAAIYYAKNIKKLNNEKNNK